MTLQIPPCSCVYTLDGLYAMELLYSVNQSFIYQSYIPPMIHSLVILH